MKVSFPGLLGILFIGLKLAGVINWAWIWVLCPLWIGLAVFTVIVFLTALCLIVVKALS